MKALREATNTIAISGSPETKAARRVRDRSVARAGGASDILPMRSAFAPRSSEQRLAALSDELIDLDRKIDGMLRRQPDVEGEQIAGYEDAETRRLEVLELIASISATSAAGLRSKARVLQTEFKPQDELGTEDEKFCNVIVSLTNDLLVEGIAEAVSEEAVALRGSSERAADAELIRFGKQLAKVDAFRVELLACEHSTALHEKSDENNYEEHWRLRARMEAIQPAGLSGLAAKARAAELALKWDEDAACESEGSFRTLARSLIRDVQAIAGLPKSVSVEKLEGDVKAQNAFSDARLDSGLAKVLYQIEDPIREVRDAALVCDEVMGRLLRSKRDDDPLAAMIRERSPEFERYTILVFTDEEMRILDCVRSLLSTRVTKLERELDAGLEIKSDRRAA